MYYDPIKLEQELIALVAKYRTSPHPIRPDFGEWAVQVVAMALRAKDWPGFRYGLTSNLARKAGVLAISRVLLKRIIERLSGGIPSARRRIVVSDIGWLDDVRNRLAVD
jgi:hypothetical protein